MGDTGAYLIGSWIGRHPLGLGISPNKTREGLAGGLLFSLVFAAALRALWLPFLGLAEALLVASLLFVAGFFGDLFESLLKRAVASKDSADLIPGHGGMMDRLDSLLFSLPVFYWFLLLWVFRG
jgi:phosphatidate cytidylyltransferase